MSKDRIVVVGDENFTLGFELVGIDSITIDKIDTLFDKNGDVGIVIINKNDFDNLSLKQRGQVTKSLKPLFVILSEEDIKGNSLREQIIKSFGVDLLKDKN